MPRSKTEIYLHIVWATRFREPVLVDQTDRIAREAIREETRRLGCVVLALGGVADHLHLLVRVPGRLSVAQLAKQVKGASSRRLNEFLPGGEGFRWQEGYGAFSVSRSHLPRVTAYVEQQVERHAQGNLWPEWEEAEEETDILSS